MKRVYLPKPNGKQRALGIPTTTDRVVQTAVMLVLEPIFEADLPHEQYAYRPKRSALDAVNQVYSLLNQGLKEVVEADLSAYFDTIPHAQLLRSIARRVVDRNLLRLIKQWLKAAVEEQDNRGNKRRATENKDSARGTPQGAPISPLLSNLYMRRFILGWDKLGLQQRYQGHIVNYADDLVICCRYGAKQALSGMRQLMARLGLTVNEEKSRVCRVPEETFNFLGYTFGRCYSPKSGRAYLGTRPSRASISRMIAAIHLQIRQSTGWREAAEVVKRLNWRLRGWANYFYLCSVSKAYRRLDDYSKRRLRWWLCKKHKVRGNGYSRYPDEVLHDKYGLIRLPLLTQRLPWAKA